MSRRFWAPLLLCLVVITAVVAQVAKPHQLYTFQIIAQDGDVIDGKTILRFSAAGPASPGAPLLEDGFSLNNSGQIASNAVTSEGPAMFIAELSGGRVASRKGLVSAGTRVSGHEVFLLRDRRLITPSPRKSFISSSTRRVTARPAAATA